MSLVILPTSDILREYQHFETAFDSFHHEGLKGAVRNMVVMSDDLGVGHRPYAEICDDILSRKNDLIELIVNEYLNTPEAQFWLHTKGYSNQMQIEAMAQALYQSVVEMMTCFFARKVFDINKQQTEWVGDDLLIEVTDLEQNTIGAN